MKKLLYSIALFLVTTSFFGQTAPSYYEGVNLNATGTVLFEELATKIKNTHSGIPYTDSSTDVWDACKLADEDPDISTNVLLIYGFDDNDGDVTTDRTRNKDFQDTGSGASGVWNREHVFSKSLANPNFGTDEPGPGTDVHNLRPADRDRNEERSNRPFTEGSGDSHTESSNGGWYPGDEWKGDVARIVMYMYTRYHGDGSQVLETNCLPINVGFGTALTIDSNMIDLFLEWNVDDPVSAFEANRNELLAGIQMNRNPFIDNPYLATLIWGGLNAEDNWNMGGSSDAEAPTTPTNLTASNETDESFDLSWDASTDNVGVYDYLVYLDGVYVQSPSSTSITIVNLDPETTYTVTIIARDVSSNISEVSSAYDVTTLVGPKILLEEDFEDCGNSKFFTYNEASSKNWECTSTFGEYNSGSFGINGYQEEVLSKDWLITKNPINFDTETGAKLSFYASAAYGSSPLVLVYCSNYDGSSNPKDFVWELVPNITIPIKSNTSGTEEIFIFTDKDISAITGTVYFAFKYYSNGEPTRWTVDSFEITSDVNDDIDDDGVLNVDDNCPTMTNPEQADADADEVGDACDACSNTPAGESVNASGCSSSQLDDDEDGIMNNVDVCPNTPVEEAVDTDGCGASQLDDDNDGVMNDKDLCDNTTPSALVDAAGCFTLPSNNFSIEVTSETCPGKNNGQIKITAQTALDYTLKINNAPYNFTTATTYISANLPPETYDICIGVTGQNYTQCYTVQVEPGTTVSGKTGVVSGKASIEIAQGTAPFMVFVNGQEQFETSVPIFSVDVKGGDVLEVKTAITCEGIYSKTIDNFDAVFAYPNPTQGTFEITVSTTQKEVIVELYSILSKLISVKTYPVVYGKVQLSLENKPTGLYIAKVLLDEPVTIKIIKQ